jgi:hypothetical protein
MPVPPLNDRKKERKRNESQNQMIKIIIDEKKMIKGRL